jgi:hypothetical protein
MDYKNEISTSERGYQFLQENLKLYELNSEAVLTRITASDET